MIVKRKNLREEAFEEMETPQLDWYFKVKNIE